MTLLAAAKRAWLAIEPWLDGGRKAEGYQRFPITPVEFGVGLFLLGLAAMFAGRAAGWL